MRPIIVAVALLAAVAAGAASADKYKIASVMHTPLAIVQGTTLDRVLESNLLKYRDYAVQGVADGAQLVLYPESGTGFLQVPGPMMHLLCEAMPPAGWAATGCTATGYDNTSSIRHRTMASCLAQQLHVDIVINYCAVNATTGKMWNVDVGFTAGTGAVGAVYLKSHVTGTGKYLSQPTKPDPVTFNSSFGVVFGMFTCYDFWFLDPALQEMTTMGVTDFLFPSEMASGPPFFSIAEAAVGWSHVHDVNVAGSTSFGTGFAGAVHRGTLIAALPPMPANFTDAHAVRVNTLDRVWKRKPHRHNAKPQLAAAENVVELTATESCVYGPPVNSLNFTFPCVSFVPQAGTRYVLSATHGGVYGAQCNATLLATSDSQRRYVLGAVSLDPAPTQGTPSADATLMCGIYACEDPSGGCMTMSLFDGWASDLKVRYVTLETALTGSGWKKNTANSTGVSLYPLAAWTNGADGNNGTTIKQRILSREELIIEQSPGFVGMYAFSDFAAPMRDDFMWNFGLYASQFTSEWTPSEAVERARHGTHHRR